MKSSIKYLLLLIASYFTMASCELHSTDNGLLDNFWYLREIDTLSTQGVNDYVDQKVFWSFTDQMMQVQNLTGTRYLLRLENAGETFTVHSPANNNKGKASEQVPDSSLYILNKFGLHLQKIGEHNGETFQVEQLTHEKMTLSSPDYRLHFIRY